MSNPVISPAGSNPSSETPRPPAAVSARGRGVGLLLLILLLVNAAAVWGQAGWALEHIVPGDWDWRAGLALALAFAAALELIGVFLATMADQGEDAGLPSGGVRLGSYAVGLISGALNFSHWDGPAAAFAFGFLSSISPFLWGIWARVRRGRPVAPSRRFWHPIRSLELIRYMAWHGIVSEMDAITEMEFRKSPELVPVSPAPREMSKTDWAREALTMKEETGWSWEKIAGELGISASYLYQCRRELGAQA